MRAVSHCRMTIEQVLELLAQAMRSEEGFVQEFLRREEFCRAAEAAARRKALTAFRDTLLDRLSQEGW